MYPIEKIWAAIQKLVYKRIRNDGRLEVRGELCDYVSNA